MNIPSQFGHVINGEFVEPASGEYIDSIDPHEGSVVTRIARGTKEDVDKAVAAGELIFFRPPLLIDRRQRLTLVGLSVFDYTESKLLC